MANYSNSVLATAQAKLMGKFQAGEMAYRDPVVLKAFLQSGPIMMPGYEEIKKSYNRTLEAYYNKRQSRSLGSTIDADSSGTRGDSGVLTPSWAFKADEFKYSLKQSNNNVFSLQEFVNNELENVLANFAEGLEGDASDFAFNNRATASNAVADLSFNETYDVHEIFTSKEKRAIQIIKGMMDENKFSGNYIVFADQIGFSKLEYYANQGGANSENLQFQFSGVNIIKSIEMYSLFTGANANYNKGGFVVVPMGMISALPWIEPQYREGKETLVQRYSTFSNPVDGINYGVQEYDDRSDESSSGGGKQDVATEVQVHTQIAFDHAPIDRLSGLTPLNAVAFVEQTTSG